MKYGATARGRKALCTQNNRVAIRQPFTATQVSVIDSVVITEEMDTGSILAEWIAYDPSIAIYSELTAAQSVKLFLNWSDRNGSIDLHEGDFFTFVVPDVFDYNFIMDITDAPIKSEAGDVVAIYSIYNNINNMKEVRITFTDYVENHANIFGNFWMLLYVGSVASTEQKDLQLIINDTLLSQGGVTVNPGLGSYTPKDTKYGFSSPEISANGYYIFEWHVNLNMGENAVNGFNTLAGFTFEDVIPADSPHVFLTNEIRQQLGLPSTSFVAEIGEYTGADAVLPENRYQTFLNHYSSAGAETWYNFVQWHTLANGLTTTGIGGTGGLHVTDIEVGDKLFTAHLGTITRPTLITFYTASTIRLNESALGDTEVVGLFKDLFTGSYGEGINSSLTLYRFEAGGSAQGISGDYSFAFAKVNEANIPLPGAMFSLFSSENFTAGADRFVFSDNSGNVAFNQLPAGTFYVQETVPPFGYPPNTTVYKVVLSSAGFDIYYGPNYENRLSDIGNRVINEMELEIQPALVILPGRKNLAGGVLAGGMFSFVVKDSAGNTVANGTNDAAGNIQFSRIEFDTPGVYSFTVEEVQGSDSGIIYDGAIFSVTVTVTAGVNENLVAEVSYPNGGIVFNNIYTNTPVEPCPPCPPYPCLCPCLCLWQCYAPAAYCEKPATSRGVPSIIRRC